MPIGNPDVDEVTIEQGHNWRVSRVQGPTQKRAKGRTKALTPNTLNNSLLEKKETHGKARHRSEDLLSSR